MGIEQLHLIDLPRPAVDARDTWTTPRQLFALLDREFRFIVDLAASESNALVRPFITAQDDALSIDWPLGGWCWLNPPFSMLLEFTAKVWQQCRRGVSTVVLVPGHRHEQQWFHDFVLGKASEIRVPRGRVAYQAPEGVAQSGPAFPSMVLVYRLGRDGLTTITGL